MLFDTHAHLDDERFDEDRWQLLEQLPEMGISLCMNAGADMESSQRGIEIAEKVPYVYAAVGIHPHDAASMKDDDLKQLEQWITHPKVKAIGEIGLDYYYDFSPREQQKECFVRQLEFAAEKGLPVIIHVRDAYGDFMELLRCRRNQLPQGVLHCFSGSWEVARECIDMGFYISFAGPLTFKNAAKLRDVAAKVPESRILIETDSPYLAPVPLRGSRNQPGNVRYVAETLAEIRNLPFEDICRITKANGEKLFHIPHVEDESGKAL